MLNRFYSALVFCLLISGPALGEEPDWQPWAEVLKRFVTPGERDGMRVNLVDYAGLKNDPTFSQVVTELRAFDPARLEGHAETLAFYINAYNILTVQLILDHWPVSGIRRIGGLFRSPWSIVVLENRNGRFTLDDIEHRIIRPMGESRIHFAVNCASLSCPDLRTEPYTASRLEEQLDDQTRRFLADAGKGVQVRDGKLRVSRLFDWYGEDFDGQGGVLAFLHRYDHAPDRNRVNGFIDYDWSLNTK